MDVLLNNTWMDIHNPEIFFQTLLFMGMVLIMYLVIVPSKKQYKKLIISRKD